MDTGPLGLSCGIWHLRIESGSLQILRVAERESVDTVRSSAFHGCLIGCGSRLFWSSGPCTGTGLFDLFLKLFLSSFCYLAGTSSCWETPLLFGNFSWSPTFKRVDQVQLKPKRLQRFPGRAVHCNAMISVGRFTFNWFQCVYIMSKSTGGDM